MVLLRRLLMWQKLLLLVIALLIPAALLTTFYLAAANDAVRRARSELDGARYMNAVSAFLYAAIQHRAMSSMFLNGDESRKNAVAESESDVENIFREIDVLDAELGKSLDSTAAWQALRSDWAALSARTLTLAPDDSFAQHNELIRTILDFGGEITMQSGLARDPDLVSSSLVSLATGRMTEAVNRAGIVRDRATAGVLRGYLSDRDRSTVSSSRQDVEALLGQIERQISRVAAVNAGLSERLTAAHRRARDLFASYSELVDAEILEASEVKITGGAAFDAANDTFEAFRTLADTAYDVMRSEIEARAASAAFRRNVTMSIVVSVVLLSLALSWVITRLLTRPMARAVSVFGQIANGHYDNEISHSGEDEAAQVLRALDEMQGKLRKQIESERGRAEAERARAEAERATAAENNRIRSGLDKSSASVMLADEAHRIIYCNDSVLQLFRRHLGDFRRDVPALDPDRIIGMNLDVFHRNSTAKQHLLNELTTGDMTIGGRSIRVVVSPVVVEGKRIGTVVEWLDRTQEVRAEEDVSNVVKRALEGNVTQRVPLEGKTGFFESLSRGLNELLDNMSDIIRHIKDSAGEVSHGAEEISSGTANLSQRTEEQASSLEQTSSAMEEMTSTVKQNADNAGQAEQLAIAARDQAERGGAVVTQAVHAMADINEASKKIADIIGVIDEIAFQTNLLALNAAVEAARAGEQGRGFAVVATEVRNLAGRSATAAKAIKGLIQDSVRKVEDGSLLVTQSGQTLEHIVTAVKKVSDIVTEIAAASREQSSSIEQVNRAVTQMDEITQQNAALVEQTSAASGAMAARARELNEMMARYRITAEDARLEAKRSSRSLSAPKGGAAPAPAEHAA